tara:strand:- start:1651 stop:2640 length:990 start_codon:yes stop_codon:yes gene_type:complete
MQYCFDNFTDCFTSLVKKVYEQHDFVSAPRGMAIKESLGVSFEITNPRNRLLYVKSRKFSLDYMIAECLWYFSGNNETKWISKYSKFWSNISDDGVHANSAYGHRIFTSGPDNVSRSFCNGQFISQWKHVKNELSKDSDSRRAVIHIKMPTDSQYNLDVPCTLTLQYFIRNNKLYAITNMRSTDIIFGLSYDVPAFTLLQELMALELGVELGTYKHLSNSLHVYERHFDMCENIIAKTKESYASKIIHPMEPMSCKPDIDMLMKCENEITNASEKDLLNIRRNYDMHNNFWQDWVTILLARKAKKLKLSSVHDFFVNTLNFSGYKRIIQ